MNTAEYWQHLGVWSELAREARQQTDPDVANILHEQSAAKAKELSDHVLEAMNQTLSEKDAQGRLEIITKANSLLLPVVSEQDKFEQAYSKNPEFFTSLASFYDLMTRFGIDKIKKGHLDTPSYALYVELDQLNMNISGLVPRLIMKDAPLTNKMRDLLARVPLDKYFTSMYSLTDSFIYLTQWSAGDVAKEEFDVKRLVGALGLSATLLSHFSNHPEEFGPFYQSQPDIIRKTVATIFYGLSHAKSAVNGLSSRYKEHIPSLDEARAAIVGLDLGSLARMTQRSDLFETLRPVQETFSDYSFAGAAESTSVFDAFEHKADRSDIPL